MTHRRFQYPPLRIVRPQLTKPAVPQSRFHNRVHEKWQRQQALERRIRYVALFAVTMATTTVVLASLAWLSVHQAPGIQQALTVQVQP
jgi:hypothetical protein